MLLQIAVLAVLFLVFGTAAVIYLKSKLADSLQKTLLDVTERVTRNSGEMKDSITERLGKHFLETQERIDRTLGALERCRDLAAP